jgi:uncharacterized membrane protein
MKPNRIEALTDGTFAIVMTLLVLELAVPVVPEVRVAAELPGAVLALWPRFVVYALSFIVLGLFWIAHHIHFQYIVRVNRPLLWINILGLLLVALIPFSTALLGDYFLDRFALLFYGANLFLAACGGVAMWWYAAGRGLLGDDVGSDIVKRRKRAGLITLLALLLATLAAFLSAYLSLALFVLIALLSLLPERKGLLSSIQ